MASPLAAEVDWSDVSIVMLVDSSHIVGHLRLGLVSSHTSRAMSVVSSPCANLEMGQIRSFLLIDLRQIRAVVFTRYLARLVAL